MSIELYNRYVSNRILFFCKCYSQYVTNMLLSTLFYIVNPKKLYISHSIINKCNIIFSFLWCIFYTDLYSDYGIFQRLTKLEEEFKGATILCMKLAAMPKVK